MPGPCSQPDGDRREWQKMNEITCNVHKHCWPDMPNMDPYVPQYHEWVTNREWLFRRNKLRTGKTP